MTARHFSVAKSPAIKKSAAFGEAVDVDMLVERVRVGTAHAGAVESRDPKSARGISVRAAAGRAEVRRQGTLRLRARSHTAPWCQRRAPTPDG